MANKIMYQTYLTSSVSDLLSDYWTLINDILKPFVMLFTVMHFITLQ